MTEEREGLMHGKETKEHIIYNPVAVNDVVGVIILGILSFILLAALLRSQARNRELLIHIPQDGD